MNFGCNKCFVIVFQLMLFSQRRDKGRDLVGADECVSKTGVVKADSSAKSEPQLCLLSVKSAWIQTDDCFDCAMKLVVFNFPGLLPPLDNFAVVVT